MDSLDHLNIETAFDLAMTAALSLIFAFYVMKVEFQDAIQISGVAATSQLTASILVRYIRNIINGSD
jgi:hypothetical protein